MSSRPHSEAAERNRAPIESVLAAWLGASGRMLEIGAGTGQHSRAFAARFAGWSWQPSEHPDALATLRAGLAGHGMDNLHSPIALDVRAAWPDGPYAAVYSANTAHIMHWPEVVAMFGGVAHVLAPGGRFFLYGPFMRDAAHHAQSNAEFDRQLRARDPEMGIRDLAQLDELAARAGLERIAELLLPANNHMLILERSQSR